VVHIPSSCDDSASVLRPSTALHQRQQRQARMRRSRGSLRGSDCGNLISGGRHLSSLLITVKGEVFLACVTCAHGRRVCVCVCQREKP
jgi:hypothetical protein